MSNTVPSTPAVKATATAASTRKQRVERGDGAGPAPARERKASKAQAPQAKALKQAVAAPAALPAEATAAHKPSRAKEKLVRDSFTMPRADFALIQQLKDRSMGFKRETRKSELLRAGLQALAAMEDTVLKALLDGLPKVKTGRPRKTR